MDIKFHLAEMNHFLSNKKKERQTGRNMSVLSLPNHMTYFTWNVLLVMSDNHVNMFILPGDRLLSVEIGDALRKA